MSNKQSFVKTSDDSLVLVGEPCESYKKIGAGELLVLPIKRSRNPKYHRLAMSWLTAVFQNQDLWDTFDQMRYDLTIQAGFIKHHSVEMLSKIFKCSKCGHQESIEIERHTVQPESLSFESMDEARFQEVTGGIDKVLQEKHNVNIEMGFH